MLYRGHVVYSYLISEGLTCMLMLSLCQPGMYLAWVWVEQGDVFRYVGYGSSSTAKSICEIFNWITHECIHIHTYLRNLAGTDYKLQEDNTIVSKHVGAV